jgi:hypothetical protein
VGSGTTPLQTRIVRFQRVLDSMIREQELYGGVSALIFSDCAYIDLATSLRAAVGAADLMRGFNAAHVPVRMGIGRGTFYGFKYSIETSGASHMVTKALFAGTAVVNAHAAERCGAAGCRILIHPSVEDSLPDIRSKMPVMSLEPAYNSARFELCYLFENETDFQLDFRTDKSKMVNRDELMFHNLGAMQEESRPTTPRALAQFTDTLEAFERMLNALGRIIPETIDDDDEQPDES